jgi:glucose/arabinose dehydrogenase
VDTLPGFTVENAFPDAFFNLPVQVVFLPDGRKLVVQANGRVWTIQADGTQLPTPFIDLSVEVRSGGDLGMLGAAIDPDFTQNRWVYLTYTVDPNMDGIDNDADHFARLTRYRASAANPNVADLATRQVLIGATWPFGIPSLSHSHTTGAIRFARDKTLLLGAGDGAHYEKADRGGLDPLGFGYGKTDSTEDMGAFRSRSLNSLSGKILRVNKDNGSGLSSNPFWNGDPISDRSRIWVYGLRSPFRFSVRPGTGSTNPNQGQPGAIYIGDVGWNSYEELNIVTQGGKNLGWPCFEGPSAQPDYEAIESTQAGNTNVLCATPANPENPASPTPPQLWWHHSDPQSSNPPGWTGATAVGGVFYAGNAYPPLFQGRYYLADFISGWIRSVEVDSNNNYINWSDFVWDADWPVDIEADPLSGDLFYVAYFAGEVRRIRYTGAGVEEDPVLDPLPDRLLLARSQPNPFTGSTLVSFELPAAARVRLRVYDVFGRMVRSLLDENYATGRYSVSWDGRDETGQVMTAGTYFYRIEAGDRIASEKILRVR